MSIRRNPTKIEVNNIILYNQLGYIAVGLELLKLLSLIESLTIIIITS